MRWLLIDRLLDLKPGVSAVGVRCFSRSEEFFIDHFPGYPVVPGVLHIEMVAMLGGMCIRAAMPGYITILTSVKKAKFIKPVIPGDQAFVKVDVLCRKGYAVVRGHIEVGDKKVSEAEVMFAIYKVPKDKIDQQSAYDLIIDSFVLGDNESGTME